MADKRKQSDAVTLSTYETDVLLGLYSGCECLWNVRCSEYKARAVRLGAFRSLVSGMKMETGKEFSVPEILDALLRLKATYKQELQQAMQGESTYRSNWRWFPFLNSFLKNHVLQQGPDPDESCYFSQDLDPASKGQKRHKRGKHNDDDDAISDDSASFEDDSYSRPAPSKPTKPTAKIGLGARPALTPLRKSDRVPKPVARFSSTPTVSPRTDSASSAVTGQIAESLKNIHTLLATNAAFQRKPSIAFAQHIANELDQIADLRQRKQCMMDIQKVIFEFQTGRAGKKGQEGRTEVGGQVQGFQLQLDNDSLA